MISFKDICLNNIVDIRLYEGDDNFKETIKEYNKLGFYTFTSQPSESYKNDNVSIRKQRAYVRGYMENNLAEYIYNKFKNHEYIIVRTTEHNELPDLDIKFGSVSFINGEPMLNDWSYNLSLPLRRPFTYLDNISEIHLFDVRWDNNELWDLLLKELKLYNGN